MQEEHINKRFDSLETLAKETQEMARENQSSLQDLIEVINEFAGKIESDISALKSDVSTLKSDMASVKSNMVTKSYLDDKLGGLRADLTILIRKEDTKLVATISTLAKRKALTTADKKHLLALEPFPQR